MECRLLAQLILTATLSTLEVTCGAQAVATNPGPKVLANRMVLFTLHAPLAKTVTLTGEYQQYHTDPMTKGDNGQWTVTVGPLDAGMYWYLFNVDGVPTVDPGNGRVKTGFSVQSIFEVPAVPAAPWQVQDVPHGTVHVITYKSKSLAIDRSMHVYTPPGYKPTGSRYPVLYLLHGSGDNDAGWTEVGRANAILDNLIAGSKAVAMVLVMPMGHTPVRAMPDGTPAFEADLLRDVIPIVNNQFHVESSAAHTGICGLSMGGSQAVTVGLRHPDIFGWVVGMSVGTRNATEMLRTAGIDASPAKRSSRLVWIGCGESDGLFTANKDLQELLVKAGYPVQWHPEPGVHWWPIWRNFLAQVTPLLFR